MKTSAAAEVASGAQSQSTGVQALVVPGSGPVKAQAEAEGLDKILSKQDLNEAYWPVPRAPRIV